MLTNWRASQEGDSGFDFDPYRAGVVFGTSKGGFRSFDQFMRSQLAETAEKYNDESRQHWTHYLSDTPALMLAKQFNFKYQRRTGRNDIAGTAIAVAHLRRQREFPLLSDQHADNTLVPTLDDLARA